MSLWWRSGFLLPDNRLEADPSLLTQVAVMNIPCLPSPGVQIVTGGLALMWQLLGLLEQATTI